MSTVTIGESLKEARTKKSLSLDEIHAKIKIHPRVLQLLEEGKFDKLPSPLFAKSFLRSYAEFLGLNPDEVIDAYGKEGEAVKKDPDQVLFIKSVDEKMEFAWKHTNVSKFVMIAVGVVVAGLLLVFTVQHAGPLVQKIKFPDAKAWFAHKPKSGVTAKSTPKSEAQEAKRKELKKQDEWARSPEQGNYPKIAKKNTVGASSSRSRYCMGAREGRRKRIVPGDSRPQRR